MFSVVVALTLFALIRVAVVVRAWRQPIWERVDDSASLAHGQTAAVDDLMTAETFALSGLGQLEQARRRLWWMLLGLTDEERLRQDLLQACSDALYARQAAQQGFGKLGQPVPVVLDVPGTLDPVEQLRIDGKLVAWLVVRWLPQAGRGLWQAFAIRRAVNALAEELETLREQASLLREAHTAPPKRRKLSARAPQPLAA